MTGTRDTPTPEPSGPHLGGDEITSRSLRDLRDPRRPRVRVAPLPPLASKRRARHDETPTVKERPPVELSRPEEDDVALGLGLDRPLFTGNTDVVDVAEYEPLISSSGEEETELDFDMAPTPISIPAPIPRPADPFGYPSQDASVELVFASPPGPTPRELTPMEGIARVITPYVVGLGTDRGLPVIDEPTARGRALRILVFGGGALLLLGLVTLVVFLIARTA